jgi:hypothetical protein
MIIMNANTLLMVITTAVLISIIAYKSFKIKKDYNKCPQYPAGYDPLLGILFRNDSESRVSTVPKKWYQRIICFIIKIFFSWFFLYSLTAYFIWIITIIPEAFYNYYLLDLFYNLIVNVARNFHIILFWIICFKLQQKINEFKEYLEGETNYPLSPESGDCPELFLKIKLLQNIKWKYNELLTTVESIDNDIKHFTGLFVISTFIGLPVPVSQLIYTYKHHELSLSNGIGILLMIIPSVGMLMASLIMALFIPKMLEKSVKKFERKVCLTRRENRDKDFDMEV